VRVAHTRAVLRSRSNQYIISEFRLRLSVFSSRSERIYHFFLQFLLVKIGVIAHLFDETIYFRFSYFLLVLIIARLEGKGPDCW
jgi:hypothetical protein